MAAKQHTGKYQICRPSQFTALMNIDILWRNRQTDRHVLTLYFSNENNNLERTVLKMTEVVECMKYE